MPLCNVPKLDFISVPNKIPFILTASKQKITIINCRTAKPAYECLVVCLGEINWRWKFIRSKKRQINCFLSGYFLCIIGQFSQQPCWRNKVCKLLLSFNVLMVLNWQFYWRSQRLIQDTQMRLVTLEISLSVLFYSHRGHLNRVPETRIIYDFYWAGVRN